MKTVGLHLRLLDGLLAAVKEAHDIELPYFQCFLTMQVTKNYIHLDSNELKEFLYLSRFFKNIFIHGSYAINLASAYQRKHPLLFKELKFVQKLHINSIVLHPGAATDAEHREEGIDIVVRHLNYVLSAFPEITIILENTAHGNKAIGSDITDFSLILQKINYPERVRFCIDTAHAYAHGYDITEPHLQDAFIALIEEHIGIEKIALIHLNDAAEKLGSKIDRHAVIGQGLIGREALKRFACHPKLIDIPIILELPVVTSTEQRELVIRIEGWRNDVVKKGDLK